MPKLKRPRTRSPAVIDKEALAREIRRVLRERGLTQTAASYIVRDAPTQISRINTGHLVGFSAERMLAFLTRLGRDVEIRVRPSKGRAGKVRVVRG